MSKDRARIQILSALMSYPTINQKDWESDFIGKGAQIGDLVSLNSAPPSKWYVSWVRDINVKEESYLLESIDDGALCWWSNVGFHIYNRDRVKEFGSTWQWDDKQFTFNDRWHKIFRRNNAHMIRPLYPVFGEDGTVTLDVYIRFGIRDFSNKKTFPNWKKLTMKTMDEFYKDCERKYEAP